MAEPQLLTTTGDAEYLAIEAAVMETARGRWFMAEYARRNRTADTQILLEAIGRLEETVNNERAARDTVQGMERLRFDLTEMAKAISRTKSEIAAIRPDHDHSRLVAASEALDAIVRTTEQATSDILQAAEQVQEAAWTLRESGANMQLCDELDRRATDIYTACSFQDLTAQRTSKIVQTLRFLESRIDAMIEIWGGATDGDSARAPRSPTNEDLDGIDLSQGDVDSVIMDDDLFSTAAVETAVPPSVPLPALPSLQSRAPVARDDSDDIVFLDEAPPRDLQPEPARPAGLARAEPDDEDGLLFPKAEIGLLHPEALAELDSLDTREKLRRFT